MPVDTPAYVVQPTFITNGVKVQSGTNWDLSRGAVATPIVALADPEPVRPAAVPAAPAHTAYRSADRVPMGAPAVSVGFSQGHVALRPEARGALRELASAERYIVVGHADLNEKNGELLARQRANAVAAHLKRQGFKVIAVKSFGSRRSLVSGASDLNRRVDVLVRE
jgi:outer membrane protein OmpA-like peptidoglycan-associated protein